ASRWARAGEGPAAGASRAAGPGASGDGGVGGGLLATIVVEVTRIVDRGHRRLEGDGCARLVGEVLGVRERRARLPDEGGFAPDGLRIGLEALRLEQGVVDDAVHALEPLPVGVGRVDLAPA